jgi:hypothetical protein
MERISRRVGTGRGHGQRRLFSPAPGSMSLHVERVHAGSTGDDGEGRPGIFWRPSL